MNETKLKFLEALTINSSVSCVMRKVVWSIDPVPVEVHELFLKRWEFRAAEQPFRIVGDQENAVLDRMLKYVPVVQW